MPADIRLRIFKLWHQGLGLRSTQIALERVEGISLDRETIWRAFVEFSWGEV